MRIDMETGTRLPTTTEQVYDWLYESIVRTELLPGEKMSEAALAARLAVSRQPVRDAFYRLSQKGLVLIRPQRATTVAPISRKAVREARFTRTALEAEVLRSAAQSFGAADIRELDDIIRAQEQTVDSADRMAFHLLDDKFHQAICDLAGLDYIWQLIRENKAHMDRVRFLSLSLGAKQALGEHRAIVVALAEEQPDSAIAVLRPHLARIHETLLTLSQSRPELFAPEND